MILEIYTQEALIEEASRREVKEVRLALVHWEARSDGMPWTFMEARVTFPIGERDLVRHRALTLTELTIDEKQLKEKSSHIKTFCGDLKKLLEEKGLEVHEHGEWRPDETVGV